ncbi:MAG: helix-turn-helix transcriptional regulator [Pseudobutyrivibrio sp.]|mgnify:FL=1|nr:helix-turn-helix transcriptional regulator [Pseudobutyrivibrio sp.]
MLSLEVFFSFIKKHKLVFLTYVAMLLIPLIMLLFCVANANTILKRDAHQYQNSILTQKKTICDNAFDNTRVAINMLTASTQVRDLSKSEEFNPKQLYEVSTLTTNLTEIKDGFSYISSLGVYFVDNDSFVTNSKRYAAAVYPYYLGLFSMDLESFLEKTEGYTGYCVLFANNSPYILMYQNMYDYHSKEVKAVAYAIISWDEIINSLGLTTEDASHSFFIQSPTQYLLSSKESFEQTEELPSYDELITEDIFLKDGVFYSGMLSDELDLCYVISMPKSTLYKDLNLLLVKFIAGTGLSLILGFCLAAYFTHKNSTPVNYLLSIVNNSKHKNKDVVLSESYRQLEDALRLLLSDNHTLAKTALNYNTSVSNSALLGFLKGIYPNEDWILNFHEQEAAIKDIEDYQIMVFHFHDLENCKFILQQKESMESYSLLYFSLQNVINECLIQQEDGSNLGISLVQDNMVICILPYTSADSESSKLLAAQNCIDFFDNTFDIKASVSLSNPHSLWTEISDAYNEATIISSHAEFWEDSTLIKRYQDESTQPLPEGNELLQLKKKLTNSLLSDNFEVAREVIDDILDNHFHNDINFFAYNLCQSNALISMLIDKLSELGLEDAKKAEYAQNLMQCKSRKELKQMINDIFDELSNFQNQEQPANGWVNDVKKYIEDNFRNPDLSVAFIAEHFNISSAHIGNRFRKLTGMGLLDYVHMLRIEQCKILLAQGLTIKDCAAETGYTDIKTLQRAFKRYEGITPGQYKEQNQ